MKKYEYTSRRLEMILPSKYGSNIVHQGNYLEHVFCLDEFNTLVSQMDDQFWEFMGIDSIINKDYSVNVTLVFRKPYIPEVGTDLEIQLKSQEKMYEIL